MSEGRYSFVFVFVLTQKKTRYSFCYSYDHLLTTFVGQTVNETVWSRMLHVYGDGYKSCLLGVSLHEIRISLEVYISYVL